MASSPPTSASAFTQYALAPSGPGIAISVIKNELNGAGGDARDGHGTPVYQHKLERAGGGHGLLGPRLQRLGTVDEFSASIYAGVDCVIHSPWNSCLCRLIASIWASATLMPFGYELVSSSLLTVRPALVVVAAMSWTIVW